MNTELAIQKAVEGGYVPNLMTHGLQPEDLLDPDFWQALGKTEGWWEKACKFCGEPNQVNGYCRNQHVSEDYSNARFYQHRLIDAIQQGRSINEFFGEILKK